MKNTPRLLLLVPALLLAGCCANDACNCDDLLADAIYFKLDPQSFRPSDADTVYLFQYSTTNQVRAVDSVRLVRHQLATNIRSYNLAHSTNIDTTLIILSNTAPFSPRSTGGKFSQYNYVLSVPKGDSLYAAAGSLLPRPVYMYRIANVTIKGQYQADGCCTCYQNTKKTFSVNGGATFDATENSGSGGKGGNPVPLVLHK